MVRGERRRPTSAHTFRRAQRLRDEGRFEEAAALVDSGLVLEPGSVVGHLLAGSLHVILRETGQARTSFERHAVIEGAAETTYLRADDAALLTLAFDRDVKAATAIAHLERVWANCRSELA